MSSTLRSRLVVGAVLGTALMIAVGGCAPMQAGVPQVQNCGIVGIGSPTKYACSGKVYTSLQLLKMREQAAPQYAAAK